jgi:hypothetical protein
VRLFGGKQFFGGGISGLMSLFSDNGLKTDMMSLLIEDTTETVRISKKKRKSCEQPTKDQTQQGDDDDKRHRYDLQPAPRCKSLCA